LRKKSAESKKMKQIAKHMNYTQERHNKNSHSAQATQQLKTDQLTLSSPIHLFLPLDSINPIVAQ